MQPPSVPDREALRRAVFALRQRERRRSFPARVHVGDPDGSASAYAVERQRLDAGLRADVVARLLQRRPEAEHSAAWLTRPGPPEPHDLDLLWLPAVVRAFAEAGEEPRWVAVVTKGGWYDPTGEARVVWRRLRIRT